MMLMMLAPLASIMGAPFHKFRGIRLQPFCFAPGGVKLKMTTSGPNPRFWAQNRGFGADVPGFGPDVVILGVLGGNPRKWVESLFMLPALPAPGRSPFNTSIAQLGVHPHLTTTATICHYIERPLQN